MEKPVEEIQYLKPYLLDKTQEELDEILKYGEIIRERGERKKKGWWSKHSKEDFEKLLEYKWENQKKIEKQYKYLDKMDGIEKKRFIKEYLYNDILYSGKIKDGLYDNNKKFDYDDWRKGKFDYDDWKKGKVVPVEGVELNFYTSGIGNEGLEDIVKNLELKEGMSLRLDYNNVGLEGLKFMVQNLELEAGMLLSLDGNEIGVEGAKEISKIKLKEGVSLWLSGCNLGAEGAEAISKIELQEGVYLNLSTNEIGDEGAKAIAENLKLKEGVELNLRVNCIGDKGVAEIAKNLELKDNVCLDLSGNRIYDEGAQALIDNMKLKKGVKINLINTQISPNMGKKLKERVQGYIDMGIKCEVSTNYGIK